MRKHRIHAALSVIGPCSVSSGYTTGERCRRICAYRPAAGKCEINGEITATETGVGDRRSDNVIRGRMCIIRNSFRSDDHEEGKATVSSAVRHRNGHPTRHRMRCAGTDYCVVAARLASGRATPTRNGQRANGHDDIDNCQHDIAYRLVFLPTKTHYTTRSILTVSSTVHIAHIDGPATCLRTSSALAVYAHTRHLACALQVHLFRFTSDGAWRWAGTHGPPIHTREFEREQDVACTRGPCPPFKY